MSRQQRRAPSTIRFADRNLLRGLVTEIRAAFGAAGASLTVLTGAPEPLRLCDPPELELLELVQHRHREGPVPQAVATGEAVVVPDLAHDAGPWPAFSRAAAAAGIRSCLALPLQLDRTTVGAVAMYGTVPHPTDDREIGLATLVAALVAQVVVGSRALEEQELLAAQLQSALDSRVELEQAKGMVAAARSIEVQAAFELIRATARRNSRTIASLAHQIVEGGSDAVSAGELRPDDAGRA